MARHKKCNLLVSGKPGVGKTTLIERVIERLRGSLRLAGFTTTEVRNAAGARTGFAVVTAGGRRGELARAGFDSRVRVGRYGVNLEEFERLALPELARRDVDLIVIDEIGKMECASGRFRRAAEDALDSPVSVLATIGIFRFSRHCAPGPTSNCSRSPSGIATTWQPKFARGFPETMTNDGCAS